MVNLYAVVEAGIEIFNAQLATKKPVPMATLFGA